MSPDVFSIFVLPFSSKNAPARDSRDPRQRGSRPDPRKGQPSKDRADSIPGMPGGEFTEFRLPPLHVDPPVTNAVMLSMTYRMHPVETPPQKPYYSVPSGIDPWHEKFKSDPRVQKYIARTGGKKAATKTQVNGDGDSVPASLDPRRARHTSVDDKDKHGSSTQQQKMKDPRRRKPESVDECVPALTSDLPPSLLSRTMLDQLPPNKQPDTRLPNPHLQRMSSLPLQNIQVHSLDPRRVQKALPTGPPPLQSLNRPMFNRQPSVGAMPSMPPVSGGLQNLNIPRFPNNPRMMPEPPFTNSDDPWSPDFAGPVVPKKCDPRSGVDLRLDDNIKLLPIGGMQTDQRPSADPRAVRKNLGAPNLSAADSRLSQNTETVSDSSSISDSTQGSSEGQTSEQKKFDHRNNPKFKRKPASALETCEKRFTGQRKSSMEYSSPLGMNDSSVETSSGYNSYNRPSANPPRRTKPADRDSSTGLAVDAGAPAEHNVLTEQGDGFNLPNMMAPPQITPPQGLQEPPLKDLFKSIDPTASPFC